MSVDPTTAIIRHSIADSVASPIRSSPLTAPPHFSPARTPSPSTAHKRSIPHAESSTAARRRFSQPASSLSRPRSFLSPLTPSSTTPATDTGVEPAHPASPPLSRSQPLLGSYQLSLLHSRMSRTTSHSVAPSSKQGFSIRIGAIGKGKTCPPELRCPSPLTLPLPATYYDLLEPLEASRQGASQTPWVGTVDLEQRYFEEYVSRSSTATDIPPEYPGYRVAPVGQLQIIVKTALSPIKVFLIPYDLRNLPLGGRLLVRERTFVDEEISTGTSPASRKKEFLRYAIQLQFACHPSQPLLSRQDPLTTRRPRHSAPSDASRLDLDQLCNREYYLSKSLKVIFTAQSSGLNEELRTDRHDEVVPPSEPLGGRSVGFSPGSMGGRRSEDWVVIRQKWLARKEVQDQADAHGRSKEEESADLVSPTATAAPLPILSPLAHLPTILSAAPSRTPSRPETPNDQPLLHTSALQRERPESELLLLPKPQKQARKARRQGSGSMAERELSEKLRMMEMKNGEG